MAVDTEQKRWSMLAFASNPVRTHVFNPATSGLADIEKITVLQYYGGIDWDDPAPVVAPAASGGGGGGKGWKFVEVYDRYTVSRTQDKAAR